MVSFVRKIWIALQSLVKSTGLSDAFFRRGGPPALGLCVKYDRLEFVLLAPKDCRIQESIELDASTDLNQACQSVVDMCHSVLGPDVGSVACWIGTDRADSLTPAITSRITSRRWLRPVIDLSTAQVLAQILTTHLAELSDRQMSDSNLGGAPDEDWLEIAHAQSAPAMDYSLLSDEPASEPRSLFAWLWWAPKDAEDELRSILASDRFVVTGLAPNGTGLYRGLREIWRHKASQIDELAGRWALLDIEPSGSAAGSHLWWFLGSRFCHLDRLDIASEHTDVVAACATRLNDADGALVVWRAAACSGCALSHNHRVFDHALNPWDGDGMAVLPEYSEPGVIALGLALQARAPKTSDWCHEVDMPVINLLPWRGAALQQRRRGFTLQLAVVACLTLAGFIYWSSLLQAQVTNERTNLADAQKAYDQAISARAKNDRVRANLDLAQQSAERLIQVATSGNFQLARLHFLLSSLPDCLGVDAVATAHSSASVSGIVSDASAVTSLAADLFEGFDVSSQFSLDEWPTLVIGEQSVFGATATQESTNVSLRLSFAQTSAPDDVPAETDKPSG